MSKTAMKNDVLSKAPLAPVWLTDGAKKHFRDMASYLVADRVLWATNVPRLAMACKYFDISLTAKTFDEQKRATDEYMKLMKYFDDLRKPQNQGKTAKAGDGEVDDRFSKLFS